MPFLRKNLKFFILIFLFCSFLGLFISHKQRAKKRNYSDFHCFYVTGRRVLEHKNIYVLRDQETAEFRYAPAFAVFISGFALLDENSADSLWFMMNFVLLVASLIFLKKLIIQQELNYKNKLIFYGLALFGAFRFILHNFDAGQSNMLMLASIILGLYYIENKREALGGAIFALSVMIKYTPLIFIPYFLLRRKFRLTLIVITFIAAYLLLPALFLGFKTNLTYLKELLPYLTNSTIFDQMTILDPKNQSLLSAVTRYFTNCVLYFYAPPMPFQSLNLKSNAITPIFLISSLVTYFLAISRPRGGGSDSSRKIDYSLLIICVIIFNLNAWKPTFVLLLIPYCVIIDYLIKTSFRDKIILTLLSCGFILNIITMDSVIGKNVAYKLCFYSPLTLSALITYIILLKLKFSKGSEEKCVT